VALATGSLNLAVIGTPARVPNMITVQIKVYPRTGHEGTEGGGGGKCVAVLFV
jgi:hypothetical protein